jgi:Gpi18-like mannosyltransferase
LSPIQGYKIDLSTFSAWFLTAAKYGPRLFYTNVIWCDYPPFNVYIFWIFGSLGKSLSLFGTTNMNYILKLPSNIFDIATAYLLYIFLKEKLDFKSSIVAVLLYTFNPSTIFNTSIWGQFDAIYTFFLVLSIILILKSKYVLSSISFTLGFLTKPQSIALAPLILFLIAMKKSWKDLITSAFASVATILILIVPLQWSNPIDFLFDIYKEGYGNYPYNSVNAFNFWALFGFWKSDGTTFMFLDLFTIGWLLFGLLTAFSLLYLFKRFEIMEEDIVVFTAFILLFGFFMLPTRIHERYIFPVFSILALIIPFVKKTKPIYGSLSLTFFANQAYILPILNSEKFLIDVNLFILTATLINIVVFLYSLTILIRMQNVKTSRNLS